jgi:hypothetical protein
MAFQRGKSRGGGGREPLEYIITGTTYREVNKEKVEDAQEEWQLAVTVPVGPVKTKAGIKYPLQELIEKLQEVLDTNGDLGARLVMYCSPRENQKTGEEFSATNLLVQPKMEQKPGRGGGFKGGRAGASQGRRSYPPARNEEPEQEEEEQDDAPEATPPPRAAKAPVGRAAPKSASPSKKGPPEPDELDENVPI